MREVIGNPDHLDFHLDFTLNKIRREAESNLLKSPIFIYVIIDLCMTAAQRPEEMI